MNGVHRFQSLDDHFVERPYQVRHQFGRGLSVRNQYIVDGQLKLASIFRHANDAIGLRGAGGHSRNRWKDIALHDGLRLGAGRLQLKAATVSAHYETVKGRHVRGPCASKRRMVHRTLRILSGIPTEAHLRLVSAIGRELWPGINRAADVYGALLIPSDSPPPAPKERLFSVPFAKHDVHGFPHASVAFCSSIKKSALASFRICAQNSTDLEPPNLFRWIFGWVAG